MALATVASTTSIGSVSVYRISKQNVTNAQYVEFLNAVASTDSFGGPDPALYNPSMESTTWGGIARSGAVGDYSYSVKAPAVGQGPGGSDYTYDNKPVVFVSFFDAMRFANWLHNGQGNGDTETGVYSISDGVSETRSVTAEFWIPSEDEWYKAAYYDPNAGGGSGAYYDYPTGSDTPPNNNLPSADTGNSANFWDGGTTTGNSSYPLTDVGAYAMSASPYGTFDQGGNVNELNETLPSGFSIPFRGANGGDWALDASSMSAEFYGGTARVTDEFPNFGFRVASIPEPSTILIGSLAVVGILVRRRLSPIS